MEDPGALRGWGKGVSSLIGLSTDCRRFSLAAWIRDRSSKGEGVPAIPR